MAKLSMKQFSDWLGYDPETVSSAIEIVRISDSDGAYTHAQDMGEDEMAEVIEAIYFEHGSLKDAIQACKEDLGLIEESINIEMIDQAISNEKDSKQKNKLVGIRANVLHKKPLTKSQTELAKKYNILESKENTNKMKTQKIKLTELRQLVKQIIKEEQSNKKVIKESKDFTVQEFLKHLKEGPYTFPGAYPKYFITKDGGILSFKAAKEMKDEIISAINDGYDDQWLVVGVDINWEDSDLYCDHTNEKIECAYCEDEPIQESTKPKTQKIKLTELRQLVKGMLKEGNEKTPLEYIKYGKEDFLEEDMYSISYYAYDSLKKKNCILTISKTPGSSWDYNIEYK
jgi:hypothetical protein